MPITLTERPSISEGASKPVQIDGTGYLAEIGDSTTFSSVDSVSEVTTSDLTLSSEAINSGVLRIKGRSVAIGKAIEFSVAGQQSGTTYRVRVTFTLSTGSVDVVDVLLVCV